MRKRSFFIYGGVLCLILTGCASGENNNGEENVKNIVENLFEDLDDSQYEALRQTDDQAVSDSVTSPDLPQWVEDRFKEDMTEEGYASFTGTAFYEIPAKAYEAHNWIWRISIFKKRKIPMIFQGSLPWNQKKVHSPWISRERPRQTIRDWSAI